MQIPDIYIAYNFPQLLELLYRFKILGILIVVLYESTVTHFACTLYVYSH